MMIPATLALLVTFAAPSPAESGDASFANALTEIQGTVVPKAQEQRGAATKPHVPAKPPVTPAAITAPDAAWKKIIELVKKDGMFKAGNPLSPSTFSIETSTGDPKADHSKRMIAFVGMLNDEEQFEAMGAMMMVMTFTLDAKTGNFNVDQWLFEIDLYGEVTDQAHMTGVMTPEGKPLAPPTPDKVAAGDAKIKTAYDAETKFWSERSPK